MEAPSSNTLYILLTFLVSLIPFLLIYYLAFRKVRDRIKSPLNYCVLALFSLVGLALYYLILFCIALPAEDSYLGLFILGICYHMLFYLVLPIGVLIPMTLILTIIYLIKSQKSIDRT